MRGLLKSARGLWPAVPISIVIGILCGLVGAGFYHAIAFVTALREAQPWLIYLLPVGALAVFGWYRLWRTTPQTSVDTLLDGQTSGDCPKPTVAAALFGGTVLTHLFGGSSGREGAALLIGGGLAALCLRAVHTEKETRRTLMLAGMAALFAALFGTPVAAVFFVLELHHVGRMDLKALVVTLTASFIAYWLAGCLRVSPTRFALPDHLVPSFSAPVALRALALALLCGGVSWLFVRVMHAANDVAKIISPNVYLRSVLLGSAVLLVGLLSGTADYYGAGGGVIARAVHGEAVPLAFFMKILLTALTLAAGYKGGEIVPAFFVGATFGCAVSPLLGLPAAFGGALGLVSVFAGVTNTPAAAVMLSAELFGGTYFPYFAIAALVAMAASGHVSLYHRQVFD